MQYKSDMNSTDCNQYYLYEYATVRYMPDIERGEFVNIGLVMMCKRRRWIRSRFEIDSSRIGALLPGCDISMLEAQIAGFERVSAGDVKSGGPIAMLEPHERFRWLTAVRSACLRTSRPHAGQTTNLEETFDRLFDSLVKTR